LSITFVDLKLKSGLRFLPQTAPILGVFAGDGMTTY